LTRRTAQYLADMLEAVDRVCDYTTGMKFARFSENEMAIDAVLRNLEILGEAARHVPQGTKEKHPGIPWKNLVGLRNIVAHQYHGVDLDNIWKIIRDDLPPLRRLISEALAGAE